MYIVDDIAYTGKPTPFIKVSEVRPLDNFKLKVRFTTGELKIFDFKPLLTLPVFVPLADKSIFDGVYSGTLSVVFSLRNEAGEL